MYGSHGSFDAMFIKTDTLGYGSQHSKDSGSLYIPKNQLSQTPKCIESIEVGVFLFCCVEIRVIKEKASVEVEK